MNAPRADAYPGAIMADIEIATMMGCKMRLDAGVVDQSGGGLRGTVLRPGSD
jgi:hypothetical protein